MSGTGVGPTLGEPAWQRLSRAADGQLAVLVAPTLRKPRQRVRHFVIDLQTIAVRVGEIDTALIHMIHRALNPHAVLEQAAIGLTQRPITRHLEGDVGETERPGRTPARLRVFVLCHVQRVKVLTERHEQVAMLGILLGDAEAEDITVEGLGPLEIRHSELDMSELFEPDHGRLRVRKDKGEPLSFLQEFFEPLDNFTRLRDYLFGQRVKLLAGYGRDWPSSLFCLC
jgi:hypothetical protein